MFKLDLEKAEKPEMKLPASVGSQVKQESSRTLWNICFTDYTDAFVTTDCRKVFKRRDFQTTLPASGETCM